MSIIDTLKNKGIVPKGYDSIGYLKKLSYP